MWTSRHRFDTTTNRAELADEAKHTDVVKAGITRRLHKSVALFCHFKRTIHHHQPLKYSFLFGIARHCTAYTSVSATVSNKPLPLRLGGGGQWVRSV